MNTMDSILEEFDWILGFSAEEISRWIEKTTVPETQFAIAALIAMAD